MCVCVAECKNAKRTVRNYVTKCFFFLRVNDNEKNLTNNLHFNRLTGLTATFVQDFSQTFKFFHFLFF